MKLDIKVFRIFLFCSLEVLVVKAEENVEGTFDDGRQKKNIFRSK